MVGLERAVEFYVRGAPIPQGSLTAHAHKRKDNTIYASVHYEVGSKLHRWRRSIAVAARDEWGEQPTYHHVRLTLTFYMKRPLSHYKGIDFGLKPRYDRVAHETAPDLDKLVRAVMDALSEVIYADDKQVTEIVARKIYVPQYEWPEGVQIVVRAVP